MPLRGCSEQWEYPRWEKCKGIESSRREVFRGGKNHGRRNPALRKEIRAAAYFFSRDEGPQQQGGKWGAWLLVHHCRGVRKKKERGFLRVVCHEDSERKGVLI